MDAIVDSYGKSTATWQHELYDLLRRAGITQFGYVPDAGHSILIDRSLADPDVHSVRLTTEEEGVALIAGADLGGARAVLLMQSSAKAAAPSVAVPAPASAAPVSVAAASAPTRAVSGNGKHLFVTVNGTRHDVIVETLES